MNYARLAATLLAMLTLSIGYLARGLWAGAAAVVLVGLLWLIGQARRWSWIASPGLVGFAGGAAIGALLGVPPLWLLIGVVAALAAWDLDNFERHLREADRVVGEAILIRAHIQQLLLALALPTLLGAAALAARIQLGFWWVLLLAALAVAGLRWIVIAASG